MNTKNNTKINLPTDGGKVLVELGYKTDGGEFITLEYKIYDFGVKKDKTRKYSDWFEVESEGIHQEMYEIASRSRLIGGSEEHLVWMNEAASYSNSFIQCLGTISIWMV